MQKYLSNNQKRASCFYLIITGLLLFIPFAFTSCERSLTPTDTNRNYVKHIWVIDSGTEWKFLLNDYDYYHPVVSGIEGLTIRNFYFSFDSPGSFQFIITYPDKDTEKINTNIDTALDSYYRNAVWFHPTDFSNFTYNYTNNALEITIIDRDTGREFFNAKW